MLNNTNKAQYSVLLYYCFTPIHNPEVFREHHHLYCLENNLRGRIIISDEGINGTLSGTQQACEKYMRDLKSDKRFQFTHFKSVPSDIPPFEKLHVRLKKEIINANLPTIKPYKKTGKYITPKELQKILDTPDVVLLDVRSNYEHRIGKFKGAVTLDIHCFREFSAKLYELIPYKGKKIVTYCTGGVKCEKASAYLLEQGFQNVYQLQGGVIQYGIDTNGKDFEGKCYVFDRRLVVDINKYNPSMISQCHRCRCACDRMINCANLLCNIHIPMCIACSETMDGACSTICKTHPKKRKYNSNGYYVKQTNGYNPFRCAIRKKK